MCKKERNVIVWSKLWNVISVFPLAMFSLISQKVFIIHHTKMQVESIKSFWDHQFNWSDSLVVLFLFFMRKISKEQKCMTYKNNVQEREESNSVVKTMKCYISFLCSNVFLNFSKSIHCGKVQEVSISLLWDHKLNWSDSLGGFFFLHFHGEMLNIT